MKKLLPTALFLILFCAASSLAEIHPKYYREYQQSSPERIRITVTKVKKGFCFFCSEQNITVTATVQKVERSASGLKPGSTITIEYVHYIPPKHWAGPSPIPILSEGSTYIAFLRKDTKGTHYKPAARGFSFGPDLTKEKNL